MSIEEKIEPILVLKKDECIPIMRKAWIEKKLSRLNGSVDCLYRSAHGCCIIGAVLPDSIIAVDEVSVRGSDAWMQTNKKLLNNTSIRLAFLFGYIASDDDGWFEHMQVMFDQGNMKDVADELGLKGDERYGY